MTHDEAAAPGREEWGVYELTCESCRKPIVVVALDWQWQQGITEVQEVIERDGMTLCRVCRHVQTLSPT